MLHHQSYYHQYPQQGVPHQGSPGQKVLTPPSSPLVGMYPHTHHPQYHQMSSAAAALMPSPPILTSLSKTTSSAMSKTSKSGKNLIRGYSQFTLTR